MLGKHLKVSVNSKEKVDWTDFYFPAGVWCSVINATGGCVSGPKIQSLSSQLYQSYVHIRDGSLVPLQTDVRGHESTTIKTHDIQQNSVDIHIHPSFATVNGTGACSASGRLLVDD